MAVTEKLSIAAPVEASRAKILLVDDRPENLFALESILEPLEQELVRATSGTEALKQVLLHDFSVILMDVKMPDLNGFDTVRYIKERERSRSVPIIFITALDDDAETLFEGYSVGAVDFIKKPYNPHILRSKVEVFVQLHHREQQIKNQARMIQQGLIREAERVRIAQQREMEQKHLEQLNWELERRVQERTAELMEANQDMQSFCYSVAHDLRAPVRNIIATSKMLIEDLNEKLDEEAIEQLKHQEKAARRMATLINDLLRLSRLNRKELIRTEVAASAIADKAVQECWDRYPDSKCKVSIDPKVKIRGDQGLLEILFQNLFDNAFKYSPDGGTISFGKVEGQECLFVRDEGIGFDMKFESKVFRPFERLVSDNEFPGTGIGLAMVQKVVSRHGGRVWAESSPGKGSTFYFTLSPED